MTAGHCADTAEGAASARVYFQQDACANFNPATGKDPITGYPEECAAGTLGTLCATSSSIHNYGFADFAGFPNAHDVGVVILDQPITLAKYGLLPQAGPRQPRRARCEEHAVHREWLRADLARECHTKLSNVSFRERLMASSSLVNLGDSNSNLIVAVTSFGLNELCRDTDYGYRIDRQEVLDWINSQ